MWKVSSSILYVCVDTHSVWDPVLYGVYRGEDIALKNTYNEAIRHRVGITTGIPILRTS